MYLKPDGRIIRFGLRNSGGPTSPLWRMWVQGDETYLAVRTMIGISKISLHRAGRGALAGWSLATGTSRVPISGPRSLSNNWTAGPRVIFPGIAPLVSLGAPEEHTKNRVFLFDEPPNAHWRDFAVLFSRPSASTDDLVRMLPTGSDVIGPLPLRNGDAAWLATFVTPMTDEQVEYIRAERDKFRMTIKRGITSLRSVNAMLIHDAANGDTMLINIALGRENIVLGGP